MKSLSHVLSDKTEEFSTLHQKANFLMSSSHRSWTPCGLWQMEVQTYGLLSPKYIKCFFNISKVRQEIICLSTDYHQDHTYEERLKNTFHNVEREEGQRFLQSLLEVLSSQT